MKAYKPPIVTVDGLIFRLVKNTLCVLLTRRQHEPYLGYWSLPGGYVSYDETSIQAVRRILDAKANIKEASLRHIEQLYTFDTPAVRGGNAISIVYMGLSWTDSPPLHTEYQAFFPVTDLPELPYEHAKIIQFAHERLRSKVTYSNIVFALLPPEFTFTQLQESYEIILGKKLDKRNFRKKFLQLGLIEETGKSHQDGAHRPARLYRFTKQSLQQLSRNFE